MVPLARTLRHMDADSELKAVQKERVVHVLLPFITAWLLASRSHSMGSVLCKNTVRVAHYSTLHLDLRYVLFFFIPSLSPLYTTPRSLKGFMMLIRLALSCSSLGVEFYLT